MEDDAIALVGLAVVLDKKNKKQKKKRENGPKIGS